MGDLLLSRWHDHTVQNVTIQDMRLLDPHLLCTNVLRRLLSLQTPRALHQYRGHYTTEDVQRLVPDSDPEELLQTLDAIDICTRDLSSEAMVGIPTFIKTDNLHASWTDEEDEVKVSGSVCIMPWWTSPFTWGIFHKGRVNLWRLTHQQSTELDTDIRLWVSGCKIASWVGVSELLVPWSTTARARMPRCPFWRENRSSAASCWTRCAAPRRRSWSPGRPGC